MKCLGDVIDAAENANDAYLFKTRAQRLILLTRKECSTESSSFQSIIDVVDSIESRLAILGQPSEPVSLSVQPIWLEVQSLIALLRSRMIAAQRGVSA